MKKISIALFYLLLLYSCKAQQAAGGRSQGAEAVINTMACRIKGEILEISNTLDSDSNSVCSRNPCTAKVRILDIGICGSAVSYPAQQADTIYIKFIYSLTDTKTLFPTMKVRYPGMKKGNIFSADMEQRLKPGTNGEFVVYGYQIEKQ